MRATGTSSSSATIWESAVSTPVPSSTLPVKTVTRPSPPTASHESIHAYCASRSGGVEVCAPSSRGRLNVTMSAPPPVRNRRREIVAVVTAPPSSGPRHAPDGALPQVHGARPALGQAAAELGSVEVELVAQHVEQRRVRGRLDAIPLAVDGDLELAGHDVSSGTRRWTQFYRGRGGILPPVERVRLGRHDEVVAVQAADGVGPPGHRDPPPLGEERGMVALLFRDGPHPVGEGQGGGEVGEGEDALQPPDPVALDDAPARNLGLELARLRLGHGRRVAPAGDALLARQATHQPPALRIAVARSLPPSWA